MTKNISNKIRVQVLFESGFSKAKTIAKRTGIPERTVTHYISKLREGESLDRKPYHRNSSKVTPPIARKIIRKVRVSKRAESARSLGRTFGLDHKTVIKILRSHGFDYRRRLKRLSLTQDNMKIRLKWARKMVKRESDWPYTIFTDETSFWLHKAASSARWMKEGEDMQPTRSHGPKVHVWGGISAQGALPIRIFEENLTAQLYVKILKSRISRMRDLYPEGYILQQDNDPKHRSKLAMEYIYKHTDDQLEWPPYSPDISPIENIWAWLKNEVAKDSPQTIEALKKSIHKNWNRITPNFLVSYIDSMPNRIGDLIASQGGRISY